MRIAPTGELRQRQPRQHDEKHLAFIRKLSCAVAPCAGRPIEAAHIRMGSRAWRKRPVGAGEKPDDRWTVPLCARHHGEQHAMGDEARWWRKVGRDPFQLADSLWCCDGDEPLGLALVAGRITGIIPW